MNGLRAREARLNPRSALRINLRNDRRAPLLFIAGEADHVIPASEYPRRSRFTMIQDGWEDLADYALSWSVENATAAAISARTAEERHLLEGAAT